MNFSIYLAAARVGLILGIAAIFFSACSKSEPPRGGDAASSFAPSATPQPRAETKAPPEGMALIPEGDSMMGDEAGFSHERPTHPVRLRAFYMDVHELTNRQFAEFVEATKYVTDAEKWKWSIVFDAKTDPATDPRQRVSGVEWWVKVDGADWRHPTGPDSSIDGRDDFPVVQVSWNDAAACCAWAGKRLPTEAEWEYAARGGLPHSKLPWGDELQPAGKDMANIWQGVFPAEDMGTDGYLDLAPVMKFPPNGLGLYDMGGNVWEWTADWYEARYYDRSPRENPPGPESGEERVMRGGSFMCAENYCMGWRVSHRNKATPDSGLNNTGFRCALDSGTR